MAIKHATVKAPGQKLFAVADWNANHTFLQTDIDHNLITNTHNLTTDISHDSIADVSADDHHPQSHTLASHSTKAHAELTNVTSDQHHAQAHTLTSHSTKAHTELTNVTANQHHAQSHTIVSHSDTTATGPELDTLTDNSMADTLHRHSELSASDGTPDRALVVDTAGNVGIGTASPGAKLESLGTQNTIPIVASAFLDAHATVGIGLSGWQSGGSSPVKSAIFHKRKGSYAIGDMIFAVDPNADANNVDATADMVMYLQGSTGNVGIGTSTPGSTYVDRLPVLEIAGNTVNKYPTLLIRDSQSKYSIIDFGDAADHNIGSISYDHTNDIMRFRTNDADRVYIDSVGQVGIGVTPGGLFHTLNGNWFIDETDNAAHSINWIEDGTVGSPAYSIVTDLSGAGATGNLWKLKSAWADPLIAIYDSNVGIRVADPHSALEVAGAISSAQITITASSDDLDVSGVNSVAVVTAATKTIGGLQGGVEGQVVHIFKVISGFDLIIEHAEGVGTQDIITPDGLDITLSGYGGVTLVYIESPYNRWYVISE